MKLALVLQQLAPDLEGGSERAGLAQALGLRARGHQVWIVCGTPSPWSGVDLEETSRAGLRVVRIPRQASERWEHARVWPRVAALAARACEGADVIHAHHSSSLGAGLLRALAREAPLVATLHDAFVACPRAFRRSPHPGLACPAAGDVEPCVRCLEHELGPPAELLGALQERSGAFAAELAAAQFLIAPSASHARRLREALGEGVFAPRAGARRLVVVPPGPTRALQRVRLPADLAPPPGSPLRVLHLGNPGRAKGTLDLVHALSPLAAAPVELDLLGPAREAGLVEAVEAVRGALRVRWLGPYDTAGLVRAAREAHLAALPSRLEESYGLCADEALALGLPAWVSDRGAPAERIAARGCGRVLPAADPGAWTAAFAQVLADPRELVRQGGRIGSALDDGARELEALESLYRACAARAVGGAAR